jgi:predicted transcriptional regulator
MSLEALALDEMSPPAARKLLRTMLRGEKPVVGAIYSAFARWTWRVLVERRLDEGLRDWHRLILDVAAALTSLRRGDDAAAAIPTPERFLALADLVRESISAAQAAVPTELLQRAHVAAILHALAGQSPAFIDRKAIAAAAGLKDANLSRILSLLAANGLVEREARGRAAAFKITRKGLTATGLMSEPAESADSRTGRHKTSPSRRPVAAAEERAQASDSPNFIRLEVLRDQRPPRISVPSFRLRPSDPAEAPLQFRYQGPKVHARAE